jgi:3-methyladenine DNA glycosylase AlkC
LIDYVGVYGLSHPEESLEVLRQLTSLHSAELAIRPFIQSHFAMTSQALESWCKDPDEHVRRLVSEGMRPRLPWAKRLSQLVEEPELVLRFLELLKDDRSEYVRRSVANNLNDISKDHPDLVVEVCREWLKKSTPDQKRIINHATRSLVKKGHTGALEMLGFKVPPQVKVEDFNLTPKNVRIGEDIAFSFTLKSQSNAKQKLVVDYVVHFVKSNGKTSPKVFKIKIVDLQPSNSVKIKKVQSFRPISTRKHYPGRHAVEIKVNGVAYGQLSFLLSS